MADTIEQQIIGAIVSRLTTIQVSGGFNTDLGTNVEDSRPNWPEDGLPAVSVFEGTVTSVETADEAEGMIQERTMSVMVKAFLLRQDVATDDAAFARKAISDIYRAIRSNDRWIVSGTPLAISTSEKQHGIEYAPDTFEITGCQVEFEIKYHGSYFNLEA